MKVWIVKKDWPYEGFEIIGIFRTEMGARVKIDQMLLECDDKYKPTGNGTRWEDEYRNFIEMEEFPVH
jgi:hypothetical protein